MTADDLHAMALHAAQFWPARGITADDWAHVLEGKDLDVCRDVLRALKRSDVERVRPQDFTVAYRRQAPPRHVCDECAGTGMVASDDPEWQPESVPCDLCDDGARVAENIRNAVPPPPSKLHLTEYDRRLGLNEISRLRDEADARRRARSNLRMVDPGDAA